MPENAPYFDIELIYSLMSAGNAPDISEELTSSLDVKIFNEALKKAIEMKTTTTEEPGFTWPIFAKYDYLGEKFFTTDGPKIYNDLLKKHAPAKAGLHDEETGIATLPSRLEEIRIKCDDFLSQYFITQDWKDFTKSEITFEQMVSAGLSNNITDEYTKKIYESVGKFADELDRHYKLLIKIFKLPESNNDPENIGMTLKVMNRNLADLSAKQYYDNKGKYAVQLWNNVSKLKEELEKTTTEIYKNISQNLTRHLGTTDPTNYLVDIAKEMGFEVHRPKRHFGSDEILSVNSFEAYRRSK